MLRFASAISCLFFFFSAPFSFSQEYPNLLSSSKITTIGYWNNGQAANYHVKESSASYKGKSDKPHNESTDEYDLKLKVTDSTEHTYTFELTYSNFTTDPKALAMMKELAKLEENLVIVYQTNEYGQFDTILNLPELKTDLLAKLELAKGIVQKNTEEEEVKVLFDMVIDNMIKGFEELHSVEALFLTDILMLHGFYGFELSVGKPVEVEMEYPTIGDIVLSGKGNITLNAINKAGDECSFSTNERPDKEELKEYMYSLALLFMLDNKKKMNMEELNITLSTKKKLKMELSTGWMTKVVNTSTMKLTNKKGEQRKVSVKEYTKK